MSIELNSEDIIVYYKVLENQSIVAYCFWNGNMVDIPKQNKELPELQVELLEQINSIAQLETVKEVHSHIPKTTSDEI
jgi:hypothetical protein